MFIRDISISPNNRVRRCSNHIQSRIVSSNFRRSTDLIGVNGFSYSRFTHAIHMCKRFQANISVLSKGQGGVAISVYSEVGSAVATVPTGVRVGTALASNASPATPRLDVNVSICVRSNYKIYTCSPISDRGSITVGVDIDRLRPGILRDNRQPSRIVASVEHLAQGERACLHILSVRPGHSLIPKGASSAASACM